MRLIVERENEIKKFKAEEYWTVHANVKKGKAGFEALLAKVDGKKPKLENQEQAQAIIDRCNQEFVVDSLKKRSKKKAPKLPLLLPLCSRKLLRNVTLAHVRP